MTIKIIAATDRNGLLGSGGKIPWSYPEDLKYFREQTLNSVVIMGRNTYESMGSKPLPKRRNIVITSRPLVSLTNVETFPSVVDALTALGHKPCVDGVKRFRDETDSPPYPGSIWLIGGRRIYQEGLLYASHMYLTLIPESVSEGDLEAPVYFPWIDPKHWQLKYIVPLEVDGKQSEKLEVAVYKKY